MTDDRRGRREKVMICAAYAMPVVAVLVLIGSVRIETMDKNIKIWFEAESAYRIEYPMEVCDDLGSSGGKCLEIKEGMGARIYGRGGGQAFYDIQIPEPGLYALWARAYWLDGCSNSFTVKIGKGSYSVGEDSYFRAWHWVSRPINIRSEGRDILAICNREDGIKIDKLLFTQDLDFVPQELGGGLKFFDFDDGSAGSWLPGTKSRWEIRDEGGMDRSPAYYLNRSKVTVSEYSLGNLYAGEDFVFQCLARCLSEEAKRRNIRLVFDHKDRDNYSFVDFDYVKISYGRVVRAVESIVGVSGESAGPALKLDQGYHFLEMVRGDDRLMVKFDGIPACVFEGGDHQGGAVGIGSLYGDVYFDNIVLSNSRDLNYSQIFYYDDSKPVEVVQGWLPEAGNWFKTMLHGTQCYEVQTGGVAATLAGSRLWNNYSYEVVQMADGESGTGIIFYCLNNRNTYLFRWAGENSKKNYAGRKQLVRVLDGKIEILAEEAGGYQAGQRYRMKAEVLDGRIRTYIDDELVFDVYDRSFFQGRIGLWLDGHRSDLDVFPRIAFWPGIYSYESWSQTFPIQHEREDIRQGIYFCYQDNENYYLLRWGGGGDHARRSAIQLFQVQNGKETLLRQVENFMEYARIYTVAISSEQDGIRLRIGQMKYDDRGNPVTEEKMRIDIEDPVFASGRIGFDSGRRVNGVFDDIRVENIRDFHDDFRRGGDGRSMYWTRLGGSWSVGDGVLTASEGAPARIVAGEAGWKDYTYDVKVKGPGNGDGSFGVWFCDRGGSNHYMYRISYEGGGRRGELVKVAGGDETVLDAGEWSEAADGWIDLGVELDGGWIGVYEGGEPVLGAYDWDFGGGRIGLHTDGGCVVSFDDVHVGFEKPYYDLEKVRSIFVSGGDGEVWREYHEGWVTRGGVWAVKNGELVADDEAGGAFIWQNEGDYFEDVTVALDIRVPDVTGEGAMVCLGGVGKEWDSGYGFSFGTGSVDLYRDGSVVASLENHTMEAGKWYRLKFERRRGYLLGYIDGECVISYEDTEPLAGGDVGMAALCEGTAFDNVTVHTYPHLYYGFDLNSWAATDFSHWRIQSGRWNEVSSVIYTLYGEKDSQEDALLWHKDPLPENLAVSLWFSPIFYSSRGEVTITMCGDGRDRDSGYVLRCRYDISEVSDDYHSGRVGFALLKDGNVLDGKEEVLSRHGYGVRIRIEKRGKTLKLFLGEKPVLTYRDSMVSAGRMLALGVSGEQSKPVFFGGIEIHKLR